MFTFVYFLLLLLLREREVSFEVSHRQAGKAPTGPEKVADKVEKVAAGQEKIAAELEICAAKPSWKNSLPSPK